MAKGLFGVPLQVAKSSCSAFLLPFQPLREQIDRVQIAGEAQSLHCSDTDVADIGDAAKRLALVGVGEMDLYRRNGHGGNGVPYGDGGVRIPGGIEDNAVRISTRSLNRINDAALMI